MAEVKKQWSDGSGTFTLRYDGQGNGVILVSSDANNGEDREGFFDVVAGGLTRRVVVRQTGRSEAFIVTEGPFTVKQGGGNTNFNVVKK